MRCWTESTGVQYEIYSVRALAIAGCRAMERDSLSDGGELNSPSAALRELPEREARALGGSNVYAQPEIIIRNRSLPPPVRANLLKPKRLRGRPLRHASLGRGETQCRIGVASQVGLIAPTAGVGSGPRRFPRKSIRLARRNIRSRGENA